MQLYFCSVGKSVQVIIMKYLLLLSFFAFHYFYGIKEKRSIGTGKYTNNTSVAHKKI